MVPSRPPLQVMVFADFADADAKAFADAMLAAISSGRSGGAYVPSLDDLGIEYKSFDAGVVPAASPEQMLRDFQHSLVVVLVSQGLTGSREVRFWAWLGACFEQVQRSEGVHRAVSVLLDERTHGVFTNRHPALGRPQAMAAHTLGEREIRPAMFALWTLHECRLLLAPRGGASGKPLGFMRLFISHAKLDGLPLAMALKHQIQQLPWLNSFYDADDLPPGSDWQAELEAAVGSSVIVILRTDYYDQRYWCQQEVLWSESYATPAILIEARTGLNHSVGSLPFDRAPIVRIPDGNLLRIVFLAVREGLRFLYFSARVEEMKRTGELPAGAELRVFCVAPSMPALLRACQFFAATPGKTAATQIILYPDPPLRAGMREAALALVEKHAPGTQLLTPLTLATTPPA